MGKQKISLSPSSRIRSVNFWMIKYFTIANLGIAYLPKFFVETESEIDMDKPVLPAW